MDDKKTYIVMPCEVWCRVTGYYRPVHAYNEGKKQEFSDRVFLRLIEPHIGANDADGETDSDSV